jgi:hypothetical protein
VTRKLRVQVVSDRGIFLKRLDVLSGCLSSEQTAYLYWHVREDLAEWIVEAEAVLCL